MTPSHELRLKSMLRAMTEVLIPALDPKQQLAMDQAQLIVGNLKLLLAQHDKTYQFAMVELREYAALVRDLLAKAEGGPRVGAAKTAAAATLAAIEPIAALSIPTEGELVDQVSTIKQAADDLLEASFADGEAGFKAAASKLVLAQGETQILRERAWVLAVGFEMEPEALPPLEQLLAL